MHSPNHRNREGGQRQGKVAAQSERERPALIDRAADRPKASDSEMEYTSGSDAFFLSDIIV